jgi:hypothetical protein
VKIIPIFAPYLHAFKYDTSDDDEFTRLFDCCWIDPEWLHSYFTINNNLLSYENITLKQAVDKTIELADDFYTLLEKNQDCLDEYFQHLKKTTITEKPLAKQKAKKWWLRLYALKIESNHYVITGGAIKQSHEMKDHLLTQEELDKLEFCTNFLQKNGVFDADSLFEFEL